MLVSFKLINSRTPSDFFFYVLWTLVVVDIDYDQLGNPLLLLYTLFFPQHLFALYSRQKKIQYIIQSSINPDIICYLISMDLCGLRGIITLLFDLNRSISLTTCQLSIDIYVGLICCRVIWGYTSYLPLLLYNPTWLTRLDHAMCRNLIKKMERSRWNNRLYISKHF